MRKVSSQKLVQEQQRHFEFESNCTTSNLDASFNLDKGKNNKSICDRIARDGQTYSFKEIMKNFDNERDLTVNVLQFTNEKEGFKDSITFGTNIYFI